MRPALHFTAEHGWINDPHALTFHDGRYHLFHQYVPDSQVWAPHCHWGHATSSDLLTWERHDIALAPGDGDDGVWTGSLVAAGPGVEETRIFYTSVAQPDLGLGRVRVATPDDTGWRSWTKGEVVVHPPTDLDLIAFRDPFVTREGTTWRMFVGAATRGGRALALTWTSPDLDTWTFDGEALSRSTLEGEPVWMGALWECPQLFEVDGHWAMVSSVWDDDVLHYAGYALGDAESYASGRFTPTHWGQLSHGGSYYAPSFFRDREGRPGLMFWMRGVQDTEAGWASCLSVPYLLAVREGALVAEPHPDLAALRREVLPAGASAPAMDVEWSPAGVDDRLVLCSEADTPTVVRVTGRRLVLERPGEAPMEMPWTGGPVRVLVDGPVLEISSANGLLGAAVRPVTTWLPPHGTHCAWALRA